MFSFKSTSSVMSGKFPGVSSDRPEIIANEDFLSQLPEEMIFHIFAYLGAIVLVKCSMVSRRWERFTSNEILYDPRNISPLIKVFDGLDWNKHVDMASYELTTKDIPPYDVRQTTIFLEKILSSSLMTEITANVGITFLTIPKGLTFNKLAKIVESPKLGHPTKFKHRIHDLPSEIMDIQTANTYLIVITNSVITKSLDLTFSGQQALLSTIHCEIPRFLEATTHEAVTFMSSGKRLYSAHPFPENCWSPWLSTRCVEDVDSREQIGFPGFPLIVDGHSTDCDGIYFGRDPCIQGDDIGVLGVLRIKRDLG